MSRATFFFFFFRATFGCHSWGRRAPDLSWVGSRDTAQCPMVHRMFPHKELSVLKCHLCRGWETMLSVLCTECMRQDITKEGQIEVSSIANYTDLLTWPFLPPCLRLSRYSPSPDPPCLCGSPATNAAAGSGSSPAWV